MPVPPGPKLLLVEGIDDLLVVAEVFEKATGTPWEPRKGQHLVEIEWCGSDDQVLTQLGVRWKESGRRIVGVVIDADLTGTRWAQVRAHAPAETRDRLPGARLHEAVRNHSLDPRAPLARAFVDWMKRLYDL